jgi:hypothetical protein
MKFYVFHSSKVNRTALSLHFCLQCCLFDDGVRLNYTPDENQSKQQQNMIRRTNIEIVPAIERLNLIFLA